jgi:hypothetical protein
MTPAAFLKLALSLPDAVQSAHQGGADIRVAGKIFASPADRKGGEAVLKLTPEQQDVMCAAAPNVFKPVAGAWGAKGWTRLVVKNADAATAQGALWTAWRNVAPAKLKKDHPL